MSSCATAKRLPRPADSRLNTPEKDHINTFNPPSTPTVPPGTQDVLLALSEEVHRAEAEKKGATIDLPQYFQTKASIVHQQR